MNRTRSLCLILLCTTATAQDPVLDWNGAALAAIRSGGTPPPAAARNLAILHSAIHDAVNGIGGRYEQYLVPPNVPQNANKPAAVIAAAHDVLVVLYPTQAATFDTLQTTQLATIPDGARKAAGVAWGQFVAQTMIASRVGDGSTAPASYPGSTTPGLWRPTISFGGVVRPALLPQWGGVRPFALNSGQQFRPPAPPALSSFQYGLETLHVQYFGESDESFRTADQTEIANFWGYGPGTSTPPGHWNQIATEVAHARPRSLAEHARTFALLNIAMADAAICSWDCKYVYGLWRPITAIQLADTDGNPLTNVDADWTPLLPTPPFPEYTSGHSTFSGAAAAVLASAYGDRTRFSAGSDDLPGVRRSYTSFTGAAWESGISRIYGGIHFWSANVNGLLGGWHVGQWAVDHKLRRR
ncbi:MAG: phosphatase PAP2 family protein [Planctomycetes bacterium]|nr:phosphatase PAP2 family protein [Planctomycetota bacterium]